MQQSQQATDNTIVWTTSDGGLPTQDTINDLLEWASGTDPFTIAVTDAVTVKALDDVLPDPDSSKGGCSAPNINWTALLSRLGLNIVQRLPAGQLIYLPVFATVCYFGYLYRPRPKKVTYVRTANSVLFTFEEGDN